MDDLSIIIPVRLGDQSFIELLTSLLKIKSEFEIIVIGPEFSENSTIESFNDPRLKFAYSPIGRALQQNKALAHSTKNYLWFLHADSVVKNNALDVIKNSIQKNGDALYFFELNFLDGLSMMKLNALGVHLRSNIFKMPFGDQGLFMSKRTFYKLGFFDEQAQYGEDHLLVWKAHQKKIPVLSCQDSISTSPRKYMAHGWLKTTAKHLYLTYKQAAPEWLKSIQLKKSERKNTAVAIFVKTPGYSPVKSRLAATIGVPLAEEFFKLSLLATKNSVLEAIKKSSGNLEAYWAVAEKECLNHPEWMDFEVISQGEGGLGERLDHVYKTLLKKHDSVLLIGADLPQLDFNRLLEANKFLSSGLNFVMGKTDDGGFYLFGGRTFIKKESWTSVTYSSEKTANELVDLLKDQADFLYLETSFDIDHESDLKRLSDYTHPNLLPAQDFIIRWAKNPSQIK